VTISGFEMSATEITQAQYEAVMGTNPSYFKGENLPVERVSWNDAMEFCQKLSERTGQRYDLPTEAEWEYACRAGTTTKYYTGDSDNALARAGWYVVNSGKTTHPGGQKEGNSFGLYDMHGNVWEWCRDWYGAYSSQSQSNPTGPGSGSFRVLRGGGLAIPADSCRAANRPDGSQAAGRYIVGLRVVRR
jgi:formylglycine-generating enzyme required for sulfatase activity